MNGFSPTFWEIMGGGGVAIGILLLVIKLIPLLKVKNGVAIAHFETLLSLTSEQTKVLGEIKVALVQGSVQDANTGRVVIENNHLLQDIRRDVGTVKERQVTIKEAVDRLDEFHRLHQITIEKKI